MSFLCRTLTKMGNNRSSHMLTDENIKELSGETGCKYNNQILTDAQGLRENPDLFGTRFCTISAKGFGPGVQSQKVLNVQLD